MHSIKQALVFGVAAVALPLVVACGGGAAAASGGTASKPAAASVANAQQITVKGTDAMKFEPATFTVKAGQPIQVTFENTGATIHDFTLSQGAAEKVQVIAQGGKKATTPTFTIEKPGTYTFICSLPGHEAAGMKGTITAQ